MTEVLVPSRPQDRGSQCCQNDPAADPMQSQTAQRTYRGDEMRRVFLLVCLIVSLAKLDFERRPVYFYLSTGSFTLLLCYRRRAELQPLLRGIGIVASERARSDTDASPSPGYLIAGTGEKPERDPTMHLEETAAGGRRNCRSQASVPGS